MRTGLAPQTLENLARRAGPLHRLDPRVKLLGLLGLVVALVSPGQEQLPRLALFMVTLLGLLGLSRLPPSPVLRRSLWVLPFVGLMVLLLPFRSEGTICCRITLLGFPLALSREGLLQAGRVLSRAWLAALAGALYAASTPFARTLETLAWLRMPPIFVLVLSFLYRYLYVLRDEARRLLTAALARGFGRRSPDRLRTAAALLTALLVRAYGRAERIHRAMLARGFAGRLASPEAAPLSRRSSCLGLAFGLWLLLLGGLPWIWP